MKTNKLNLILLAVSIVLISSCSKSLTVGSSEIIEEERSVTNFENVEIEGVYDTKIIHGDKHKVSVKANDNILDNIHTIVSNKTLKITMDNGAYDNINIDLVITMPTIKKITKRGVGSTRIEGFYELPGLEINHFGVASFSLEGSVDELSLNKSGVGSFDAFDLEVDIYVIEQNGIGNTRLTCSNSLSGELTGIGNIYYKGQPNIDMDVTGIGRVQDAN